MDFEDNLIPLNLVPRGETAEVKRPVETNKKIVVVFPPLTMPTSPPLGAAMLKGFVERELPDWRVKVLDLNLWTFDRLFGALPRGAAAESPRVSGRARRRCRP